MQKRIEMWFIPIDAAKFVENAWGSTDAEVTTKIEEVTGDGDWAYSRGTYKVTSGGSEAESGKYV